jgi:lysophospholipase L1-like esterase
MRMNRSASDIAESAGYLAQMAINSSFGPANGRPRVLLMAPAPVTKLTELDDMFAGAQGKSKRFGELYEVFAGWSGADFFDAGTVIKNSDLDGIHFEAAEHEKLGKAVAGVVRSLIG